MNATRSLKIARTPLQTHVPLVVGTYWSCHNRGEHEICRIKLVVCDDDGFCIEV